MFISIAQHLSDFDIINPDVHAMSHGYDYACQEVWRTLQHRGFNVGHNINQTATLQHYVF